MPNFADQAKGAKPVKTKLLSEEFVLFRDGQGRVGGLELLCAHWRKTLMNGRVEPEGYCCRWPQSLENACDVIFPRGSRMTGLRRGTHLSQQGGKLSTA